MAQKARPAVYADTSFLLSYFGQDAKTLSAHVLAASPVMAERLRQAGVAVSAQQLTGASHFDTHLALRDANHPWYRRLNAAFGQGA